MATKPQKVIVIGGGVGGLSAAHELVERGFEVHVYERRKYYGGKAASVTIGKDNPYTSGPRGLPGEHGFRFFPGWYRHLPDTMKRIPYKDKTVHDNLVPADTNLLASYNRDAIRALVRFPTNWTEIKTLAEFPRDLLRLGLTADDVRFFFGKMWEFFRTPEEERIRKYDNITWADFLEADKRSRAYRDYIVEAATRNTVAAKPYNASAYAITKIAIQTLFDTFTPQTIFDRVLNGPTSEVWIEPWIDYLRGRGVTFVEDAELDAIELGDGPTIKGVTFQRARHEARLAEGRLRLVHELEATDWAEARRTRTPGPGSFSEAALVELLDAMVIEESSEDDGRLGPAIELLLRAEDPARVVSEIGATALATLERASAASTEAATADYFIFSMPIEQMAYYVNRSESLKSYDPDLRNIIRLADHVEWMAGIQFYLTDNVTITRGHIDHLDSEWALTAIAQTQFWEDFSARDRALDEKGRKVRSILSVDISAWDRRGRFLRKEAYNCTREEIAREVWEQLKEALNRPGKQPVLRDDMLLGFDAKRHVQFRPLPEDSYYLDDSIVDRFDRKKQALYDRFRSIRFSAAELASRQAGGGGAEAPQTPYRTGRRRLFNAEPLLVNRVGALGLRPTANTGIDNMFLAADYVRTNTNLATMEGANEAARAAVNQLLLAAGSREEPCKIWELSEPFGFLRALDAPFRRRPANDDLTFASTALLEGTREAAKLAQLAISRWIERK